ncbi:unnamed protein product, partial [Mesorhabditis belari]|uniref:BPTI/Kunitz inhibitor domain-containing protein n=1 Tax=Mesorhabditis belari TaxID=2138241 RepID=A0AAF3J614_9BILA
MWLFLTILIFLSTAIAQDCSQEKDRGERCDTDQPKQKFAFEPKTGDCVPFYYLGCKGTENKFATYKECKSFCSKKNDSTSNRVVDVCELKTDAKIPDLAVSCSDGNICNEGYECKNAKWCCPTKTTICNLPASSGNEAVSGIHYGRYVYMIGLKNCIRFSYFGLEGNFNNFKTFNDCKSFCGDL